MSRAARFASWLVRPLRALAAEDRAVLVIALGFAATELVTFGWDLPGSHGWENDGIAPRDLFGGLAHNLTPGATHRYPLLHYLLLGLLSLPALLAAVLSGPLTAAGVRSRVLSVPCMTAIALLAKALATLMGVVCIMVLARIVRRTVSTRAGRYAALFAAVNLTFAFYARVSNLDVPYLTWTVLALDAVLDVFESGDARAYGRVGLFGAAAVATKDQAYASFLLVVPLYFVLLPLVSRERLSRAHVRLCLRGAATGAVAYGLASGALFNPTGFVKRLAELRGPSSELWRMYSRDAAGLRANVADVVHAAAHDFWPTPVFAVACLGVLLALAGKPGPTSIESRALRLLPFVAGFGSLVFFTLAVGRSEHRFLLPFGFFLAAYAGIAADAFVGATAALRAEIVGRAVTTLVLVWCAVTSAATHLTMLGDARREVARFLEQLPRGSTVETYGLVVYAPHFDVSPSSPYHVVRVGPERPKSRNPLVGATELEGRIADAGLRMPAAIVVSEGFATPYLAVSDDPSRPLTGVNQARRADTATYDFVHAAVTDGLPGYRLALAARPSLPRWARAFGLHPVAIQGTTGLSVWVLVRSDIDLPAENHG
ncbi:MAG TPA: glycosyltransferase family 39 protein [Polyangiaceae bacterium]|nr:glycosyltransferase family 39 protein [Polyangiaceae bacterium]